MKIVPIFTRFTAGELSPRFLSRSDAEGYAAGCLILQNMTPLRHGPAQSRYGMVYFQEQIANEGRIFGFPTSQSQPYLIVVNNQLVSIYDAATGLLVSNFVSPYSSADVRNLQAVFAEDGNTMTITVDTVQPYQVTYDPVLDVWNFTFVTFTFQPVEWGFANFPSCATYFQGRIWYASTPEQPTQIWGSKPNDFYDFTLGAAADDALTYTIAKLGRIRWIEGSRNLLVGTEYNEFIFTSETGVVTPAEPFRMDHQSANGAKARQGLEIGQSTLYISADGAKIYAANYLDENKAWISEDLTFTAEHFKDIGRIDYMVFQKNPEQFIWCVTDTGLLFSCTFDPQTGIQGWARHTTDGEVLDMAIVELNGTSEAWVLVKRRDGIINLEKMSPDYFTDSTAIITNVSPSRFITVPHLANKTVQVINDGAVEVDILLDGAGKGELQEQGTNISVGLQYNPKLQTMPLDAGSSAGSAMELQKRWNRIFARLIDSALPLINGSRPPDRSPSTPFNEREPNRTQDAEVRDLGWDLYGTVTIEMDLPLQLIVSGIFGEVNQNRVGSLRN